MRPPRPAVDKAGFAMGQGHLRLGFKRACLQLRGHAWLPCLGMGETGSAVGRFQGVWRQEGWDQAAPRTHPRGALPAPPRQARTEDRPSLDTEANGNCLCDLSRRKRVRREPSWARMSQAGGVKEPGLGEL